MPRRKAAGPPWDAAGPVAQGSGRRRPGPQGSGRRRPRPGGGGSSGGSSEEEAPRERRPRDGSPGARRPGRPGGAAAAAAAAAGPGGPRGQSVVICEPEHSKERIKLEGSKSRGQLLIFGATNWDLIGRKEVPKQQAAYRNLGQNLWGPHRYGSLGTLRVRSVVSGPCAAHSLLITAEGRLWSWGRNEKGQLGHGDTKRVEAPRPIEALSSEAIVAAACGRNHTLALTESGSVFAFGENKLGQLGLGNQTDAVPSPTQILYNGQPISKLGCGAEFSMVMDCKGNLYSFGCPEYGQLGHNSDGKFIARAQRIEYDCELLPRRVALFVERTKDGQVLPVPNVVVRDVACGANHTVRERGNGITGMGQGRGLRGQPHAGAGFPEARFLLGLRGLRAAGPRGAEGRDGSQAGEALRLPGTRRRPDLRGIHLLLRRQRDRRIVLLGRHQHLPGVHHVPQGRAGPVRVEDPQPGLREELRHRGGRREHHQLGALAHLRGAGIWGPQTQIVHGGAGGENPGRDLHRAGGHGLFPLAGDRPGRVGGGAGEAAEAPGVQPPHPLRGPDDPDDPDPASPSRPPCSVPAFPALGGAIPTPVIPGFWNSRPQPGLPARPAPAFVGSGLELFFILFVFFRSFFHFYCFPFFQPRISVAAGSGSLWGSDPDLGSL
uniref:Regulator of chromosome condensation 2 n=1 Tax=Taeniopygia guttata TaxID=59729 RepID=A0A674H1X5_TAEGU